MKTSTILSSLFLSLSIPTLALSSSDSSTLSDIRYEAEVERPEIDALDPEIASYQPELFKRPVRLDQADHNNTQPGYTVPAKINSYQGGRPMVPSMIVNAYCTKEVPQTVQEFCQTNRGLIEQLLKTSYPTQEKGHTPFADSQAGPVKMDIPTGWRPIIMSKYATDEQAIKDAGLRNLSTNGGNYVLEANAEGQPASWLVKICSPIIRFINSACLEHKEVIINGSGPRELSVCKRATDQTLSRIAAFLRIEELIKNKKLEHIKVPDFRVITPNPYQQTGDENCIVVESAIQGDRIVDIKTSKPGLFAEVTEPHMRELLATIKYAGLWTISDLMIDAQGNFIICDTEQRDRQSRFYYVNGGHAGHCTASGIESAHQLFMRIPQLKYKWLGALMKDDEALKLVKGKQEFAEIIAQRDKMIQAKKKIAEERATAYAARRQLYRTIKRRQLATIAE